MSSVEALSAALDDRSMLRTIEGAAVPRSGRVGELMASCGEG